MKLLPLLFIILLIVSCFKDDEKIDAYTLDKGITVEVGEDYQNKLYFNIETQEVIKTIEKNTFDLSFGAQKTDNFVRLNSALFYYAYNTNDTSFVGINESSFVSVPKSEYNFDASNGDIDSLAITNWCEKENNEIITNSNTIIIAKKQGDELFKKLQILSADEQKYIIKTADINSTSNFEIDTIYKNEEKNLINYSFQNKITEENQEPNKEEYQIIFTQYTAIATQMEQTIPYLVFGVLTNKYNSKTAELNNYDYNSIDYNFANSLNFANTSDIIGFDWKTIDESNFSYMIYENKSYIIEV